MRLSNAGIVDFNEWYKPEKTPELDIGDADAALNNFFQFCYEAGPDKCALWSSYPDEIRNRFFEADRRLFEKPLPVPGFGILKASLLRFDVFNALYRPDETFSLLASVAAEVYNGTAGPAIRTYREFIEKLRLPAEPFLVDPTTGLKNSPDPYSIIACSDGGARVEELGPSELEDVYNRYLGASKFFAGIPTRYELVCSGK